MLEHAVFVANDKIHVARSRLADVRERREIPPAVVVGRIISEVVPLVVRRILRLKRADGIIFAVAVKVNAVGAGVAEDAVDYDSDTFLPRRVD